MNFNFKGKNVLVSGATHGIGLACLIDFAKLGANVITFSRDQKKIIATKKKLDLIKAKYFIEEGDILDDNFAHSFSEKIITKFKAIDILIHNVGGGGRWGKDNFLDTDLNVWDEVYNKNNKGVIVFTKYFLPQMIKKKWGRVVAIGSVCGIEARKQDRIWFNAAKAAQHAIIKSFSKKKMFTKNNITFNSVSPGPIFIKDTGWELEKRKNIKKFNLMVHELLPASRLGKPEDISNVCIFLCSDYASYVNGSNIVVDGGFTEGI